MFELISGDSLGRTSRFGALSLRYAPAGVALVNALKGAAVRPARETAPEESARYARSASPLAFSGETISLNVGTLPAGKSITIKFQATINNSINSASVSNQGTVSGTNFSPVVTDDPATGALGDPTVTPVGTPPTISCPANITVTLPPNTTAVSMPVNFTVGASDNCGGVTTSCSPAAGSFFPVGSTTVTCTARDTFAIQISNGYTAGGVLTGGNIQIH
jgi:hypothetical protein